MVALKSLFVGNAEKLFYNKAEELQGKISTYDIDKYRALSMSSAEVGTQYIGSVGLLTCVRWLDWDLEPTYIISKVNGGRGQNRVLVKEEEVYPTPSVIENIVYNPIFPLEKTVGVAAANTIDKKIINKIISGATEKDIVVGDGVGLKDVLIRAQYYLDVNPVSQTEIFVMIPSESVREHWSEFDDIHTRNQTNLESIVREVGKIKNATVVAVDGLENDDIIFGQVSNELSNSAVVYFPKLFAVPSFIVDENKSKGWSTVGDVKIINPRLIIKGKLNR